MLFCLVVLTNSLSLIIFQESLVFFNTYFYKFLVSFFKLCLLLLEYNMLFLKIYLLLLILCHIFFEICYIQVHSSGNYILIVKLSPKHTSSPSTAAIFLATCLMAVLPPSRYSVFHSRDTPIQLGLL